MINHFTFNGTSTAQLGLIVSGVSIFGAGSRKVEKAGIPGRNGDLQIELGGFNNYTVRYTVSITKNFTTTAQQIREWLLESKGYCDLTDTYHPDEIRKACFNSDIEFTTSMLYKYGQASIQFDCLPERYLTTNTPITTTATADTTTDTTLSLNTVPTPLNIALNGNTTQEGSSGKNIFDYKYWADNITVIRGTKTVNGNSITITATDTDSYTNYRGTYEVLFPKVTTNTNYTLSWDRDSGSARGLIYVFDEGGSAITSVQSTAKKVTFNSGSNTFIQFRFGVQASGNSITYSNIMLEKGSTATAYEPHISPTNPQPIHNVSGDNTIYIASKNLLSNDWENDWQRGYWDISTGEFVSSRNWQAIKYYIPVQPNTTYYVYADPNISASIGNICQYDANKNFIVYKAGAKNTTFTTSANVYFLTLYVGNVYKGTNISLSKSDTTTDGTYVPFTAQSYPLYLPVENLLPRRTTRTTNGVTFTVNADGSISTSGTATANIYNALAVLNLPNGTYTMTGSAKGGSTSTYYMYTEPHYRGDTGNGVTFTDSITSCSIFVASGQNMDGKVFKPQIEKGTKANHYTPYGTTPIELNKIGTYQDYIYKNGGKWYVHKETTKKTLDGINETFGGVWGATNNGYAVYKGNMGNRAFSYADKFVYNNVNGYSTMPLYSFGGLSGARVTWTFILPSTVTSLATANTWLQSNNVLLYYPLATATNTEITDTTLINQLNNIEKAYSYNGTTNILQVSNDNGFMLEVVSLHGSTFNSNYKGEPIITVNSTGLIYLNGEVMEVLSAPVTINCQTMQCYNGAVNMNNEVRVNDFPEIKIGGNTVGSSMALTITPNNWRH